MNKNKMIHDLQEALDTIELLEQAFMLKIRKGDLTLTPNKDIAIKALLEYADNKINRYTGVNHE